MLINMKYYLSTAFIRKVYGLLSIQLLVTIVIAAVFCLVKPIKLYVTEK